MLNRSARLPMSTSILEALPGKLDIKDTHLVFSIYELGPSINGLVTDRNTKLCCRSFILALFQSTTANKVDSEDTQDYKRLLAVCEAEILRFAVKRIESFLIFYADF